MGLSIAVGKVPAGLPAAQQVPAVVPGRYVLLSLASLVTGYTVKAMERKIERGDWVENKVWRRAPDGRILIDLVGYQKWVEGA
ncbi:MAG: excisionase [Pseudomonadota bacterium]|nr:excisionase [Pseudomonadota bacterium]